jgi:hypothetical protein
LQHRAKDKDRQGKEQRHPEAFSEALHGVAFMSSVAGFVSFAVAAMHLVGSRRCERVFVRVLRCGVCMGIMVRVLVMLMVVFHSPSTANV